MIAAVSTPAGSVPKALPQSRVEAGGAERVGNGRVAEADEQRALQGQRHPLDEAAGPGLELLGVAELAATAATPKRSSRGSAPAAAPTSSSERLERRRALGHRPQDVERLDVAGALPDRLQRRLAEQPRHPRLLDVAVAAEALERLDGVLGGALAGPVLEDRGRDPADQRRALVAGVGLVELPGEPEAETVAASDSIARSARTFAISGCSTSRFPKAERCSACQIACATPARIPDAEPIVQSRRVWLTISMIVGDAAALLADHPRPGAAELDLARGVRAVAELVLEPLDVEAVALAVGRPARQQEAGDAALGLGEDEEGVAHRRRAEPLVAGELVLGPGAAAVERDGDGGVGADVGAALLLGHRHPAEGAGLVGRRDHPPVVVERVEARLPFGGDSGWRRSAGITE